MRHAGPAVGRLARTRTPTTNKQGIGATTTNVGRAVGCALLCAGSSNARSCKGSAAAGSFL